MKKIFFTTISIILLFSLFLVSCKTDKELNATSNTGIDNYSETVCEKPDSGSSPENTLNNSTDDSLLQNECSTNMQQEMISEYFTFEELLMLSTDVLVGEFVKQYDSDEYTVYEFSVIKRFLGEGANDIVHIYANKADILIPERNITYSDNAQKYVPGEQYLLITERFSTVYDENDKYAVLGGLYFPINTLSESKIYGQTLSAHSKSFDVALENDSASVEKLCDFITSKIKTNDTKPIGPNYLLTTELSEVVKKSTYVVQLKLDSIAIDADDRCTYECTVIKDYKGNLKKTTICATFSKGTVQLSKNYIVALEELAGTNMIYFTLSSKNSVWTVDVENLVVATLKTVETYSLITVTQTYPEERTFTLSAEDTDFVKDLWEGEWLVDITKTACDYEFELDGNIIKYSNEAGLFNDYENQRHMILTKEQKDAVNKMLGIE